MGARESGSRWPRKQNQVLKGQPGCGAQALQAGESSAHAPRDAWFCPALLLTLSDLWDIHLTSQSLSFLSPGAGAWS